MDPEPNNQHPTKLRPRALTRQFIRRWSRPLFWTPCCWSHFVIRCLSPHIQPFIIFTMSFHEDASASSNEGAAYPWILEHLLAYPGSYEIPLRTMYTLNATTQAQQQPNPSSPTSSSPSSVMGNAFPAQQKDEQHNLTTATAAAQLRANLMSHISQIPSQPCSLPPSFVTSFVRRCFPPDLDQVDFPQALTALDYLKDLENRRRREVVAALDRLGIDRADFGERSVLGRKYPGVLRWVVDIEDKERKVEALYTQVYLGLRRWVSNIPSQVP